MTDSYLKRVIQVIINKTGIDPEEIGDDSYFEDDLNVGQLELLEIISALEEEYSVEFSEDEKENIESVMDLVELIMEKVE